MSVEFTRFERLKEEYESYIEFGEIDMTLRYENNHVIDGYHFQEEYLFQDNNLCILKKSMREFLILKIHVKGILEHFGRNEPLKRWNVNFFGLV